MGFLDLFRPKSDAERAARRWVPMIVRWRQRYPDRPFHDVIDDRVKRMLLSICEDPVQRQAIETITSEHRPIESMREICCVLVEMETAISPTDAGRYHELVRAVDDELARRGVDPHAP